MKQVIAVVLALSLAAPVFAQSDTRDKTRRGAAVGAVAGGVLGAVVGNNRGKGDAKRGAILGTVIGTAAGATIGAMMDKQERELRQIEGVEVQRTASDELNVVVKNEILFDYNSASLRRGAKDSLEEMSEVFERYNDTSIQVEGHTDSTGSEQYNYRLSQRRADSVSDYLERLGVSSRRIDTEARGETDPRASNNTASGRQKNRRVEIQIKANRA